MLELAGLVVAGVGLAITTFTLEFLPLTIFLPPKIVIDTTLLTIGLGVMAIGGVLMVTGKIVQMV
jgi:hypothetical protein